MCVYITHTQGGLSVRYVNAHSGLSVRLHTFPEDVLRGSFLGYFIRHKLVTKHKNPFFSPRKIVVSLNVPPFFVLYKVFAGPFSGPCTD